MELVKQHAFPCLFEVVRVGLAFHRFGNSAPAFGLDELILGPAVFPLHPGHDAVAAAGMMLQIPGKFRIFLPVFADVVKEVLHRIHLHDRHIFPGVQFMNAFDIFLRGAAAMVAHAVKEHQRILAVLQLAL